MPLPAPTDSIAKDNKVVNAMSKSDEITMTTTTVVAVMAACIREIVYAVNKTQNERARSFSFGNYPEKTIAEYFLPIASQK